MFGNGIDLPFDQPLWWLAYGINLYHLIHALRGALAAPLSPCFLAHVGRWSRQQDQTLAHGMALLWLTAKELLLRIVAYYSQHPWALLVLVVSSILAVSELS